MCSSARGAEHAQQPMRAAARYHPHEHLQLPHAQGCRVSGVAQVAGKNDFLAALQSRTVDRRDVDGARAIHSQYGPPPAVAHAEPFSGNTAKPLERAHYPRDSQYQVEQRHHEFHRAHRNLRVWQLLERTELARVRVREKAAFHAPGKHHRANRRVLIHATREPVEIADAGNGQEVERRGRVTHRQDAAVLLELQRVEREIAGRRHVVTVRG